MKNGLIFLFFISLYVSGFAQTDNVGIGTSNPDASALLDLSSNNKGLLIPRLSTAERLAIAQPALGLQVFDTTLNQFWFFNGSAWSPLVPVAQSNILISALDAVTAPANANENQLFTYFLPASTLSNGEGISIRAFGSALVDTFNLRFKFGASVVPIQINENGTWFAHLELYRRTALSGKGFWHSSDLSNNNGFVAVNVNFDGGVPIQLTGQTNVGLANGLVLEGLIIERIR
jgi:hypothetical protein